MKIYKRIMTILVTICLVLTPVTLPLVNYDYVEAATVKMNKTKLSLYKDNTYRLKISGTSKTVKWSSDKKSVATVSSKGTVKGIKKGTAVITATVGDKKYKCTVTVKNPTISVKNKEMEIANSTELTILGAVADVKWKSSEKSVATVTNDGIVIARAEGTAKITGTYKNKTYSSEITVVDKKLHASVTDITIYQDTDIMITVDDMQEFETLQCEVDDYAIVDTKWGKWDGNKRPLKLLADEKGTTTIKVTSSNSEEELMIKVTVVDKASRDDSKLEAEEVYEKISNATVQINTDYSIGSGFFLDNGIVVTNYHVIEGEDTINVQLQNGDKYDVEYILGYDEVLDIAILSIPTKNESLPINDHGVKMGEAVYAIGSSLGLTDTFTNGIITNTSRTIEDVNYIQTNAAITNGNSGGPLVNSYGEVMGINTMYYEGGQNLNFAINISEVYLVSRANPITVEKYYEEYKEKIINDYPDLFVVEDSTVSNNQYTSQSISSEQFVVGSALPGEEDYYQFTVTESIGVYLAGSPEDEKEDISNLYIAIVDVNNNVVDIALPYESYYGDYLETYYTVEPGTYYIAVGSSDGVDHEISYMFGISLYTDDWLTE
jgi:hypothetical protein